MSTFGRFIIENIDEIVEEFMEFARTTSPAAAQLEPQALRDHSKVVLEAVAQDMDTVQSGESKHQKSLGAADEAVFSHVKRTAQLHAQHRFDQAFSLLEMVSEYRALRAAVIRRWTEALGSADATQLGELTRFGEAMDEGMTEAISWYFRRLEESRNLLIGVLGHDLRSPLGAVGMSAEYLLRSDRLQGNELRAVARIMSSSKRMGGYVNDLLDFAQTLLGEGLSISRAPVDLAALCQDVAEEVRAAHPSATVLVEALGHPSGQWDDARLSQLVSNLVTNAILHGDSLKPVTVMLTEADGAASLTVHNEGAPIPEGELPRLFQPLMQARTGPEQNGGSSGLGLGLYIARVIAVAHWGTISVESTAEAGTSFTVRLPLS
ncbi:MAG: HAMP domain-containing histidine kinase [Methylibium sp.]|uniref:sensor histidine kinase n=1 Tax=Methylibium sp. TaxID=2067992 RepID=UPI0017D31657|nr:HAMP domain-containing sensor histidine kinase [Methylibium sp.]MBA3597716.1 HAMP domain-containing histidine kinase [Methylibium sp.]